MLWSCGKVFRIRSNVASGMFVSNLRAKARSRLISFSERLSLPVFLAWSADFYHLDTMDSLNVIASRMNSSVNNSKAERPPSPDSNANDSRVSAIISHSSSTNSSKSPVNLTPGTSPDSEPSSSSSISGQAGLSCCTPHGGTVMPVSVGERFPLTWLESVPLVNGCLLVCRGGSRCCHFRQGKDAEGDNVLVSSPRR